MQIIEERSVVERPKAKPTTQNFLRGQELFNPGTGQGMVYIVRSGCIRLYKVLPDGRSINLGLLGPNTIFTQEDTADGIASGSIAEALVDSTVSIVEATSLGALIADSPDLAHAIVAGMTRRVTELQTLVEHLLVRDTAVRLATTLIGLAQRYLARPSDWYRVQRLNSIADPYRLVPGSSLRIPLAWLKQTPAPAVVVAVSGRATATPPGETARAVRVGESLYAGTQVISASDSSITLRFADGSVLILRSNAQLALDTVSVYAGGGMADTRLRLQQGRAEVGANPRRAPGSRLQIITPSAVAAGAGEGFPPRAGGRAARGGTLGRGGNPRPAPPPGHGGRGGGGGGGGRGVGAGRPPAPRGGRPAAPGLGGPAAPPRCLAADFHLATVARCRTLDRTNRA